MLYAQTCPSQLPTSEHNGNSESLCQRHYVASPHQRRVCQPYKLDKIFMTIRFVEEQEVAAVCAEWRMRRCSGCPNWRGSPAPPGDVATSCAAFSESSPVCRAELPWNISACRTALKPKHKLSDSFLSLLYTPLQFVKLGTAGCDH